MSIEYISIWRHMRFLKTFWRISDTCTIRLSRNYRHCKHIIDFIRVNSAWEGFIQACTMYLFHDYYLVASGISWFTYLLTWKLWYQMRCWHVLYWADISWLILRWTLTKKLKKTGPFFYPRPVLAFGYCHRPCLCVCQCVCVYVYQSLACPHNNNSSAVQARITKFET